MDDTSTVKAPADEQKPDVSGLIAEYARSAEASTPRRVGATVLMTPVFDDGSFNRSGKRIHVEVKERAGKYEIFSRNEGGKKALYLLTASGRIDRTSGYFREEYNEDSHKWVDHYPTEAEIDEVIPRIAQAFENELADTSRWSKYQYAAVLNRLDECDAHNEPVRKLREEESRQSQEKYKQERNAIQQESQDKLDKRVNEIAKAIENNENIGVGHKWDWGFKRSPVIDLFKLYDIDLPLRTQGWIDSGLSEITKSGYCYYSGKSKRPSKTFGACLEKLREAIKAIPIDQKRESLNPAKPEKKYDLAYGFLGNGFTVWNRAEETNNDYPTVAHISTEREVTIYDKDMPESVKSQIMNMAQSHDTRVFYNDPLPDTHTPESQMNNQSYGMGAISNNTSTSELNTQKELDMTLSDLTQAAHSTPLSDPVQADHNMSLPDHTQTTHNVSLPDPTQTADKMHKYGYTEPDMFPLSCDKAVELFNTGYPVYLLYPDNTEVLALDSDEIITFSSEGLCGITKADWEMSPIYNAQMDVDNGKMEADLLYGSENKFGIYQIPDGIDSARDFRYASIRELESLGLLVDRANYELVYTGKLDIRDTQTNLHKIFATFQAENPEQPADYASRSVSVSDVIVMQWRGDVSAHFVDSGDFTRLLSFTGDETQPDIVAPVADRFENDNSTDTTVTSQSNPQLAKLEADVKAGKSISLMELSKALHTKPTPPVSKGKPSLLGRLEDAKKSVERSKNDTAIGNKIERGHE